MSRSKRAGNNGARRGLTGLAVGLLALGALLVPLLLSSSASASPGIATATTQCQNYPYCTTSTTAATTTTTGAHIVITLKATYTPDLLSWQACGFPASAAGTNVSLYIDGVAQTEAGGSGPVQNSGGCTTDPNIPVCLAPATYSLVAVDNAYSASTSLDVANSGCSNPITIGKGTSGSGSGLAFTGANILITLAAAALLIVLGYALLRLNRQRRQAS